MAATTRSFRRSYKRTDIIDVDKHYTGVVRVDPWNLTEFAVYLACAPSLKWRDVRRMLREPSEDKWLEQADFGPFGYEIKALEIVERYGRNKSKPVWTIGDMEQETALMDDGYKVVMSGGNGYILFRNWSPAEAGISKDDWEEFVQSLGHFRIRMFTPERLEWLRSPQSRKAAHIDIYTHDIEAKTQRLRHLWETEERDGIEIPRRRRIAYFLT